MCLFIPRTLMLFSEYWNLAAFAIGKRWNFCRVPDGDIYAKATFSPAFLHFNPIFN